MGVVCGGGNLACVHRHTPHHHRILVNLLLPRQCLFSSVETIWIDVLKMFQAQVKKAAESAASSSKKQTRLGLEAKKDENLSDWYTQVRYQLKISYESVHSLLDIESDFCIASSSTVIFSAPLPLSTDTFLYFYHGYRATVLKLSVSWFEIAISVASWPLHGSAVQSQIVTFITRLRWSLH